MSKSENECSGSPRLLCPEFSDAADHIATMIANAVGTGSISDYREQAEVVLPLLVRTYNQGYLAGHHESVEGTYVDIFQSERWEYHDEYVHEFIVDVLA